MQCYNEHKASGECRCAADPLKDIAWFPSSTQNDVLPPAAEDITSPLSLAEDALTQSPF